VTNNKPFDPEGDEYDYKTARANQMQPSKDDGHWGSVAPVSEPDRLKHNLPEGAYVILKGAQHPTFDKAVEAEKQRGAKIEKRGNRYYSIMQPRDETNYSHGGKVHRGDGIAQRGKTRGRMV
jgi:hypothetical protein